MSATIIDGKVLADAVRAELAEKAAALKATQGITPCLAVILVGEDPASAVYVKNKVMACEKAGFRSIKEVYPTDVEPMVVLGKIAELNADPDVHGILVQLPLPKQFDSDAVLEAIMPEKDVDGFHAENVGALMQGNPRFIPCTPYGVMKMLESAKVPLKGAEAVIVGRSNIVGKPMAMLLLAQSLHRHGLPFAVEGSGLPHQTRRHSRRRRRPREDDHRRHDQTRCDGDRRRHQPYR